MKLILALAGGGIKGIFQLSVLKAIFDHPFSKNIEIIDIYACSIGSIISPYILTKKIDEAIEFMRTFNSIDDISNKISYYSIFSIYNLIYYKSYYKSLNLSFLEEFKKKITDKENLEITTKLHCYALNISKGQNEFLTGPNWIDNIEASSSAPLLYPGKKIGESYYVDGNLTYNLDIKYTPNDTRVLMLNFEDNILNNDNFDIDKLNLKEYILFILSQSSQLNTYHNNNNIDKISMKTKFNSFTDFNKTSIEYAIREGYEKGKEWINNISVTNTYNIL